MISRQEFRSRLRIDHQHLERWIAQGWVVPQGHPEPAFLEIDVARGELIRELQEDFGVNDPGVSLILHLLDQLHGVRRSMRELVARVRTIRE
jgi:chaperone modulatory protein CbpM